MFRNKEKFSHGVEIASTFMVLEGCHSWDRGWQGLQPLFLALMIVSPVSSTILCACSVCHLRNWEHMSEAKRWKIVFAADTNMPPTDIDRYKRW